MILQNTSWCRRGQGPKSWEDLLDPKWKGRIAFTDPANSGSAYQTVTMLVDLWGGGEKGWKKVGELFKNMKVLNRSSLVFQGVGNGRISAGHLARICRPAVGLQRRAGEGDLSRRRHHLLDGGRGDHQGRPQHRIGQTYVDYINAKATREMILKATFRRPTRNDLDLAKLPGGLPPLSSVKLVTYDEQGWTDKRTETMEKIKDVLQDSR